MTERAGAAGLPPNILLLLGASTAAYALTLAGVAALQARSEATLAAARAPAAVGISELARGHDELLARLELASRRYEAAAREYMATTSTFAGVDDGLSSLAALVQEIDGVSRTLPTTVRVAPPRTTVRISAPATSATTGASGG